MLNKRRLCAVVGYALLAVTPAHASEPPNDPPTPAAGLVSELPDLLSSEELGALRGGQGVVLSNQTLVAITSGNVINGDYVAGTVSLSDNALSNFNGIGNVLINTGAQVSLQTGMNVTINVGE